MRRWARFYSPLIITVAAAIRTMASSSSPAGTQRAPTVLHDELVQYLSQRTLKSGNVFGSEGQTGLKEMQRYTREIEAARETWLAALPPPDPGKEKKGAEVLTDEEIERLVHKHGGPNRIKRAEVSYVSLIPTKSVHANVRDHVEQRRSTQHEAALLCNYGPSGSGKTVQMMHTTAVAVEVIGGMVRSQITNDVDRERLRPLGFYVSFTRHDRTPNWADSRRLTPSNGREYFVLTAIALRMAFAVMEYRESYKDFANIMINACDMTDDKINFDIIVAALRQVLKWEGPMFIAVDGFLRAFEYEAPAVAAGLSTVCRRLLDESPLLLVSPTSEKEGPVIYERYLAISSFYPAHAVDFAAKTNRRLIMQPTALLDLRDITRAFANGMQIVKMPPQYSTLFSCGHVGLTNEQLLFLIYVAMFNVLPGKISNCVADHSRDVPGERFGPLFDEISKSSLRPPCRHLADPITVDMRVCACELIVGLETTNIFMSDDSNRRALVLAKDLERDCFVSQTNPTRVLVTPSFLATVRNGWSSSSGTTLFIRHHVSNLSRTLETHAQMALKLLDAGPYLIEFPKKEICRRLAQRWIETTATALGDLTFRALCLRFACALCAKDGATGGRLLGDVCSSTMTCDDSKLLFDVQFASGPLVVVANNFPPTTLLPDADRNYYDYERAEIHTEKECCAFETCLDAWRSRTTRSARTRERDAFLMAAHTLMPRQCRNAASRPLPYALIQEALAKGSHFSFQPQKPIFNRSDDGVMFLREKGTERRRAWVVFLVHADRSPHAKFVQRPANKMPTKKRQCATKRQQRAASRQTTKDDNVVPLPGEITDTKGNVHILRFVRIQVTADAPSVEHEESSCTPPVGKKRCAGGAAQLNSRNGSPDVGKVPKGVIAECFMDLDTIKNWCPTVGTVAGNLVKIRQLAGAA
ncbi:multi-copy leucine-rich repeat protein, putative [Bodo saltans]|uniref:Multi-copy leucine-rich repeat protein, putative n=1 Tax=Bodo saltans TaxID=75058 RepID=A0A0S4IP50_BODSA|nr:multi-copy leucine-rich repeat protein, putative [Bodo saltans]|eukprot:CUE65438.1 multi-copy leucine-rich repeat protein, putative [Bodo saltans]